MKTSVIPALAVLLVGQQHVSSFQLPRSDYNRPVKTSELHVIGVETIGIAVISAAAGAASQRPRIQELEGQVINAQNTMESKINELEEKLFQMDKMYEDQSAKFMKEYEMKKNEEVKKMSEKMKADYKYKLDIEVEREKSKLLSEKLNEINLSADQNAQLSEMRLQMNKLRSVKEKLEITLKASEEKLNEVETSNSQKKFWPF